jgi:predicted transcriptional regulator
MDPDHPVVRYLNAPTPLARLHAARRLREMLAQQEAADVAALRSVNVSWAEIARGLGVTRQAATKRYGGDSPASVGG